MLKHTLAVACIILKSARQAVCRHFQDQLRRLSPLRYGSLRSALTALLLEPPAGICAAEKLNVLFIVSDDFRDEGGVFTRAQVKLPNLDRLAARDVRFEHAYVQYTVCNSSRSSFLTGLRAGQPCIVNNTTLLRSRARFAGLASVGLSARRARLGGASGCGVAK
jgi:hypothetical protein